MLEMASDKEVLGSMVGRGALSNGCRMGEGRRGLANKFCKSEKEMLGFFFKGKF